MVKNNNISSNSDSNDIYDIEGQEEGQKEIFLIVQNAKLTDKIFNKIRCLILNTYGDKKLADNLRRYCRELNTQLYSSWEDWEAIYKEFKEDISAQLKKNKYSEVQLKQKIEVLFNRHNPLAAVREDIQRIREDRKQIREETKRLNEKLRQARLREKELREELARLEKQESASVDKPETAFSTTTKPYPEYFSKKRPRNNKVLLQEYETNTMLKRRK